MAREQARQRFVRQWQIVDFLRASRRGRTILEIATHVELSRAQAYREMQVLLAAPLPIVVDKRNQTSFYRIERVDLPSTFDLLALSTARKFLAGLEGSELVEGLDRLLGKSVASPVALEPEVAIHDPQHVRLLESAIFKKRRVAIGYPRDGEHKRRVVEPVELRHAQKAWYATAWDVDSSIWKTFKLARIHDVQVLRESQTHPPFDPVSTYGHSVAIWSGELHDVVVDVSAVEARFAREHPLHPNQILTPLQDGGVRVAARVAGLDEVTRWVLRFGKEAQAVGPEALVTRVREQVAGAAVRYRPDSAGGVGSAVRVG